MLRKKASLAVLALAVPVVALTGCGQKAFITVDGEKVSKDEYYSRLERIQVQTPQGPKPAGRYVIEQIIGEKLILQLAQKQGVTPSDEQVESKITQEGQMIQHQAGVALADLLKAQGKTRENFKEETTARQAYINLFTKGVAVPDAEARKVYDQQLKNPQSGLIRPEQVKISAIVCDKKEEAEKAYKELTANGNFGDISAKYSTDPNVKNNRGELNWLSKTSQEIPQVIRDNAFSLEVGKFSKPFTDGKAWVILRADAKRKQRVLAFDDVKMFIKEQIAMQRAADNSKFLEDMRAYASTASIEIKDERYKEIPTKIKEDLKKQNPAAPVPGSGASTTPVANP